MVPSLVEDAIRVGCATTEPRRLRNPHSSAPHSFHVMSVYMFAFRCMFCLTEQLPEDIFDKVAVATGLALPPHLFFAPMRLTCKRIRAILAYEFVKAKDSTGIRKDRCVFLLHWKQGNSISHLGVFIPPRNGREVFAYIFLNVLPGNEAVMQLWSGVKHRSIKEPIPVEADVPSMKRYYIHYDTNWRCITLQCPVPSCMAHKMRDFLDTAFAPNPHHCLLLQSLLTHQQWKKITRL